jgi:hypothetical protein
MPGAGGPPSRRAARGPRSLCSGARRANAPAALLASRRGRRGPSRPRDRRSRRGRRRPRSRRRARPRARPRAPPRARRGRRHRVHGPSGHCRARSCCCPARRCRRGRRRPSPGRAGAARVVPVLGLVAGAAHVLTRLHAAILAANVLTGLAPPFVLALAARLFVFARGRAVLGRGGRRARRSGRPAAAVERLGGADGDHGGAQCCDECDLHCVSCARERAESHGHTPGQGRSQAHPSGGSEAGKGLVGLAARNPRGGRNTPVGPGFRGGLSTHGCRTPLVDSTPGVGRPQDTHPGRRSCRIDAEGSSG